MSGTIGIPGGTDAEAVPVETVAGQTVPIGHPGFTGNREGPTIVVVELTAADGTTTVAVVRL